MFEVGPGELLVILLLALIIFGPGRLPEVGRALGKTIHEFRRAAREMEGAADGQPRHVEREAAPETGRSSFSDRPKA